MLELITKNCLPRENLLVHYLPKKNLLDQGEDAPTHINSAGTQFWYVNNMLHRTNGPAVIYSSGSVVWYVNDVHISKDVVTQWMMDHNVDWPFNQEFEILFKLTFG